MRGTAVAELPEITLSPAGSSYDFGAVRLGGQGTFSLKVGNDGVDPLRVEANTSPPFTATPASFRVDPGASTELRVEYEPVEEGTQSGELVLRSNDPDRSRVTVSLRGEGDLRVPIAEVTTPDNVQAGAVAIRFTIADEDDSDVEVTYSFEVDGTRQEATLTEGKATFSSSDYAGRTLQVVWDTGADLPGRDVTARFVIAVTGTEYPKGTSALSGDFRVDNNQPPAASLTVPPGVVGRRVRLPFSLTDAEGDALRLLGEYSLDRGETYRTATIASETENVTAYESSLLWDAFADLGYGAFDARFRLTPADGDQGSPAEADLRVVHRAADYDGDQQIGFEDLVFFLDAWNRTPRDAAADTGPATGRVPDLIPVLDGVVDFEDLAVLIQMWNWSVGLYPAAKIVRASGGLELQWETAQDGDQTRLDLFLGEATLLAAALEIEFDPQAWELLEAAPGPAWGGQAVLLERRLKPGRAVVQMGRLGAPVRSGEPMAHFRFAPTGKGGDDLELSYDLRGTGGVFLGAGRLQQRLRLVPEQFFLGHNAPNPFNPETLVPYGLPQAAEVDLTVYDMLGRQVAGLVDGVQSPGYYRVRWDGRDDAGRPAASGIYLYRLVSRPLEGRSVQTRTRRMLLLR